MKRIAIIPLILTSLVLSVTSCAADEKQPTSAADGCKEVLGPSGIKWVESHAAVDKGETVERDGVNLEENREEYFKQMNSWDPKGYHWSSELCTMSAFTSGKNKVFRIEFGPSSVPFDFDKRSSEGVTTTVNKDVKLHQAKDAQGVTRYGIYVKCKVPGTPPQQESKTPLAGVLTDTLTEGTASDDHVTYLLRSTRAVANSLKCENKPVIPANFSAPKQ
ncbi:hypothetical protein ACIBAI_20295 [Streptomyces sp. NPDC051041]|uniref:hypothetical protein n=1 Tax=Streptomyces sp. NPDC051041 TaxID=3365640 RepID=UPI0037A105BD